MVVWSGPSAQNASDPSRPRPQTGAPMRVLHAPVNIGNQPWVLSRHERKLGLDSNLVVHYVSPSLLYPADRALGILGGRSDDDLRARMNAGLTAPLEYDVLH